MSWPSIRWSFVRGKIKIAVVAGRVFQVVVGEMTFIQRIQSIRGKNDRKN